MFGVADRVDYIESGDLHLLLSRARGVVTVNSTVGLLALGLACPTFVLGTPIYALPGLTFQGALEDFWRAPTLPDMALYRQFRKVVIHATQVNGGFYSREGIDLAITHSVPALLAEQSPLEALI
jgi:capsular polysaccharide export protein